MKVISEETCVACEGTRYMSTGDRGDRLRPCQRCEGTGKLLLSECWPESRKTKERFPKQEQKVLGLLYGEWETLTFAAYSEDSMFQDREGVSYSAADVTEWKPLPPQ
jgi:hypothetical protein